MSLLVQHSKLRLVSAFLVGAIAGISLYAGALYLSGYPAGPGKRDQSIPARPLALIDNDLALTPGYGLPQHELPNARNDSSQATDIIRIPVPQGKAQQERQHATNGNTANKIQKNENSVIDITARPAHAKSRSGHTWRHVTIKDSQPGGDSQSNVNSSKNRDKSADDKNTDESKNPASGNKKNGNKTQHNEAGNNETAKQNTPAQPAIKKPARLVRPPPRPERPGRPAQDRGTLVLQHIVITNEGGALAPETIKDKPVQLIGFFPFARKRLRDMLNSEFIGRPIKSELLATLKSRLKAYSRDSGYPFARVTIPQQDATGGRMRVVMRQSRLAEIRIRGNDHIEESRIREFITLRPGDIINVSRLDRNINALNANPAITARAVFSRGEELGTSILTLKVRDKPGISTFVAFNNTGTPSTEENQASIGFSDLNFLGFKTRLDYTHTRSIGNNSLESHYAALTRRFDNGGKLTLNYAYSRTEAEILGGALESRGWSRQATLDYTHPLPDFSALSLRDQSVTAGLEHKYTQGNVLFTLFGSPFRTGAGSDTKVYNFKLGYKGLITDPYDGRTSIDAKLFASPGGLETLNDDAAFEQAHAGADAQYAYARLEADRRAPIDLPPFDHASELRLAVRGQYAPERLIGTERFIAGAASRPRGYEASSFSGDYGYVGTVELGLPSYQWQLDGLGSNRLQLSAFSDFGMVGNVDDRPGEPANEGFASLGLGLDYTLGRAVRLQASFAQDIAGVDESREQSLLVRLRTALDPLYDGK